MREGKIFKALTLSLMHAVKICSSDIRSIRYRLYPTATQENRLLDTLEICRNLYNHFVFESRLAYKEGYRANHDELARIIPCITAGQQIYSKVAQPVIDQFYRNLSVLKSLKEKGRVNGILRFKSKQHFKSFTYNQSGFHILHDDDDRKLKLSKIGKIKIVLHREIEGIIKEIHIKRESSGKWFAIIIVVSNKKITLVKQQHQQQQPNKPVGLDVGIKNFVYDSKDNVVEHPSILKKSAAKLAKAQRVFSRRLKGSSNRARQRIKVARIHEKIANQRKDFLHKLSRHYINRYDGIFVEDLKIVGNMAKAKKKKNNLSKSILDSSWSTFFDMLEYKAENAGILFRRVVASGTSQRCSRCGNIVKKSLAIRTHCCPNCKLNIDRDHNASINILQRGLNSLPRESREVTPVEIGPIQIANNDLHVRSMNQEATDLNRW